jgi:membrane protein
VVDNGVVNDLYRIWNAFKKHLAIVRRTRSGDLLWRAWQSFSRSDGTIYAAAMTYYALLSLFPFLIFLVSLFGIIIRDVSLRDQVIHQILQQLPEGVNIDQQVRDTVTGVATSNSGLLGLTAVFAAAWTASGVVGSLRRALNRAFDVPTKRSYFHRRAQDIAGVIVVSLLLLLSTLLTLALGVIRSRSSDQFHGLQLNGLWSIAFQIVPLALSFVVFLMVYRIIPNHTLGFRDLWVGALIAALGFEAAKTGFGLYITNFGRYDQVYGALGGIVALLVFVYLVSILTILAADVSSEMAREHALPPPEIE